MKNLSFYILVLGSWLFMSVGSVWAQDTEDFKTLKRRILSEYSATDVDLAFQYTDSLLKLAQTKNDLLETEMVRAVLHYQTGDLFTALEIAMDVEPQFYKNKNYSSQISVIGFIASNFRELGLFKEALHHLDIAEKSIGRLESESLQGQYGVLLAHEKIGIYRELEDYDKIPALIEKAYESLEFIHEGAQYDFFKATTLFYDANYAFYNQDYELVSLLLNEAFEVLGTEKDLLFGQLSVLSARYYLEIKDIDRASLVLDTVKQMVQKSEFFSLKNEYYQVKSEYFLQIGDTLKSDTYKYEYIQSKLDKEKERHLVADNSLQMLRDKIQRKSKINMWLIFSFGIIILIGFIIAFYFISNSKKRYKRFEAILDMLQNEKDEVFNLNIKVNHLNKNLSDKEYDEIHSSGIAKETLARISQELELFERNKGYLDADMSLTKLAQELNTNTAYLRQLIRAKYQKTYTNYINDLRVTYILRKLRDCPSYLNYKISYLAKEAGFSSHSKLSAAFKHLTGISPSIFIMHMKESLSNNIGREEV